jgi:hypothetical protein
MSTSQIYGLLGQMSGILVVLILVDMLIALLQGVFVSGPLTYITSERHLGRPVTFGDTWSAVRGRLASLGEALFLFASSWEPSLLRCPSRSFYVAWALV